LPKIYYSDPFEFKMREKEERERGVSGEKEEGRGVRKPLG
jgi:hypothetical protein